MENPYYKEENFEKKYAKIPNFSGKEQPLELEKDFIESKDIVIRDILTFFEIAKEKKEIGEEAKKKLMIEQLKIE